MPEVPRQILMLCKAYPPCAGGVESYSEQVARAYLRRGFGVKIIAQTYGNAGWQTRRYEEGSIPLYNTGAGGQLRTGLKMLNEVRIALRAQTFDFIHATTWRPALTLLNARNLPPTVLSTHGREILKVPRLLQPAMSIVLNRAALVLTVSSATLRHAQARLDPRIATGHWVVAHNGLSDYKSTPQTRRPVPEKAAVKFLTLARLVERKNVQGALAAFASLKTGGLDNFEYVVAGSGPLASSLKKQARDSGLERHVRFTGYVDEDDIPELYNWADVFIHPQIDLSNGEDIEGFGIAIADAMAYGCLAIAGRASGPTDFVNNGVTGLLVDGTDLEDVKAAIQSVLHDLDAYRDIAASGQAYVRSQLSWDKHVDIVLSRLNVVD